MAQLSGIDKLIIRADRALRSLAGSASTPTKLRRSPASTITEPELTARERRHAAALMRVNHSGEVCAQALYKGQALTAKLDDVREQMQTAAREEQDHLHWCAERIKQLDSHTSYLNPFWYGASFTIGAGAGLISDKISLGFVAATEQQVCEHLQTHLKKLPTADTKSRVIVSTMLDDEARHAHNALEAGGLRFPTPVKALMTLTSKAMTVGSYYM